MSLHRLSLIILYLLTLVMAVYLIVVGWSYYVASDTLRPDNPLHESYKPSGFIGHGTGIVGSFLMVVLLLYSLRKRYRSWERFGNIRYWLNYHIWMGITGPILVLYHTTFKFGGIVAFSFWSMVGVVLSGVLGRYLYIQIPRSRSGQQLTARELADMDMEMQQRLQTKYGVDEKLLLGIQAEMGYIEAEGVTGWANLWRWLKEDLSMPMRLHRVRQRFFMQTQLATTQVNQIVKLIRRRNILKRRILFLDQAQRLLNYWHVIHKPFAVVMLVIMCVHIAVAVLFGYTWVFRH